MTQFYEYGKVTEDLKVIEKGEPIFVRLEAEEEIKYIQESNESIKSNKNRNKNIYID